MKLDLSAKIVFVLLALFCLAAILSASGDVFGAIAESDTSSVHDTRDSGLDTLLWEHTTSAGSDRYLVVNACVLGTNQTIDSVRYGSQLMTPIDTAEVGIWHGWSFGLIAPEVTADTVWVFFSGVTGSMNWTGAAVGYTGVDQSTPYYASFDTTNTYGNAIAVNSGTSAWAGADESDWIHAFFGSRLAQQGFTLGYNQTSHHALLAQPATSISYKVGLAEADTISCEVTPANPEDLSLIVFGLNAATAGNVTVSPAAAPAAATAVDPTVIKGSIAIGPDEAGAVATAANPTVLAGDITVGPDAAVAIAAAIDPTVELGSITIGPDVAIAVAMAVDPTVVVDGTDRVFYMAPADSGGSNSNSGTRESPYLTLAHIVNNVLHVGWGDTVMVMSGAYSGQGALGFNQRIRGHADTFLTIMADPLGATMPVIDANYAANLCLCLQARYTEPSNNDPDDDVAYVRIKGIKFIHSTTTGQGLYIHDGGCPDMSHDSRETPAHHIIIEDCEFGENTYPNHALKFAGVDTFLIQNCKFFNNGAPYLDFVGAHYGTVKNCSFSRSPVSDWPAWNDPKGAGIIAKGGSAHITVYNCYFERPGYGGVYSGQITGCNLFRPASGTLDGDGETCDYEAKDISVYCCVFNGSRNPITFRNSRGGHVFNNTIYNDSSRVAGRYYCIDAIIHTYVHTHFACADTSMCVCSGDLDTWLTYNRGGYFLNNISYFGTPLVYNDSLYTWYPHITGSYYMNMAETFRLSYNLWHHYPDTTLSMPPWTHYANTWEMASPAHSNNIIGDPLFVESNPDTAVDFMLQAGSPAIAAGSTYVNVIYDWWNEEYIDGYDYSGDAWGATMSMGAFAGPGDITVSPSAAATIATAINPTVVQAGMTVSPDEAVAVATAVDPNIEAGLTLAPDAAVAVATAIDPTVVLASLTIAPEPATAVATATSPYDPVDEYAPVARYRRRRRR